MYVYFHEQSILHIYNRLPSPFNSSDISFIHDRVPHKQVHEIAFTPNCMLVHQSMHESIQRCPILSKVPFCSHSECLMVVDPKCCWSHHVCKIAVWSTLVGLGKCWMQTVIQLWNMTKPTDLVVPFDILQPLPPFLVFIPTAVHLTH